MTVIRDAATFGEKWAVSLALAAACVLTVSAQEPVGKEALEHTNRIMGCEENLVFQDIAVSEALDKDSLLIVVLRSSKNETSRLVAKRRFDNLRTYFQERGSRLPSSRVILAVGEKVEGYGRVEYYVDGKLFQRLLYPRNGYICHSCCGPDHAYYPDKKSRRGVRRKK